MKLGFGTTLGIGVTIILFIILFFVKSKGEKLVQKFNPVSNENIVYQSVNKLVQAVTGEREATLGTKIFDAVDTVKGWLPFMESDLQRWERLERDSLEGAQLAKRQVKGL